MKKSMEGRSSIREANALPCPPKCGPVILDTIECTQIFLTKKKKTKTNFKILTSKYSGTPLPVRKVLPHVIISYLPSDLCENYLFGAVSKHSTFELFFSKLYTGWN